MMQSFPGARWLNDTEKSGERGHKSPMLYDSVRKSLSSSGLVKCGITFSWRLSNTCLYRLTD